MGLLDNSQVSVPNGHKLIVSIQFSLFNSQSLTAKAFTSRHPVLKSLAFLTKNLAMWLVFLVYGRFSSTSAV